jgi:hypothetical protein
MHYPHQGNANALDHFIVLQKTRRPIIGWIIGLLDYFGLMQFHHA